MRSLCVLLAADEAFYTFTKSCGRASIGVGHDASREAVQETERVQLVEQSLRRRHCARRGGGDLVQNRQGNCVELPGGKHPRDEPDRFRLFGFQDSTRTDEVERYLLTH